MGNIAPMKPRLWAIRRTRIFWACVLMAGALLAETCPVIPFVAITGRPTEADVVRKVATLKETGYDQFLIYARSGLEYTYMGEEWLAMTEQFCREAEKRGMNVWLYDEYNWPSGTCKGRVPRENDAYRYTELAVYRGKDGSYTWKKVLAPQGWVNVCEPEAVKRFIELTHKVYEKRLSRWLKNKTILGIFTDEPGHPTAMRYEGKPVKTFRWFSGLEEEYRAETGRDFRKDVEAYLSTRAQPSVWEVYASLMGRRFRTAYFDQIRAQCDRMGILLTGHMISEDSVTGSCVCNGDPLLALKGESLPGMDEISSRPATRTAEWLTLNVVQHAALRNGRGALVELYALGPNDMTPAKMRQMLWLEALHGVDHYLVSMEVMDMRGLIEKHGYLSPIAESQPWHPYMKPYLDEARRAARFARKTDFDRVAAIRYPQKLAARAAFAGAPRPDVNALLRAFNTRQVSFDFCAEDEPTVLPYVFVCGEDGHSVIETRSNRTFASAGEAADWILVRTSVRTRVYEQDGTLACDLIVRDYADGSTVVLNLQEATDRRLVLARKGERTPFELPMRGVLVLEPGEAVPVIRSVNRQHLWENAFALSLDRANLRRVNFATNKVGRIVVATSLRGVRLALRDCTLAYAVTDSGRPVDSFEDAPPGTKIFRHDAVPYTFEMDGKPVTGVRTCTVLPPDYRSLYRETEPFDLAPGVHTFRIVTGEEDQNYFLPAVFVAGDFAVFNGILGARPVTSPVAPVAAVGLADYVGALTYTANVTPQNRKNLRLRLVTGGLYTRVKWNGVDLGVRAWAPYEWAIPEAKPGKLEVTVYTPVANMFGNVAAPGTKWDIRMWIKPRDWEYAAGLVAPPEWIWE